MIKLCWMLTPDEFYESSSFKLIPPSTKNTGAMEKTTWSFRVYRELELPTYVGNKPLLDIIRIRMESKARFFPWFT